MNDLFNSSRFQGEQPSNPHNLTTSPIHYPFYHVARASIIPGVDDKVLSLVAPVVAYWALSLFFHVLDSDKFLWASKHRIHEAEEIKARNTASRTHVLLNVLFQQIVQTAIGIVWLDGPDDNTLTSHAVEIERLGERLTQATVFTLGRKMGHDFLAARGQQFLPWLYWWGIPIVQFLAGIFVIDTWQYFLHRALHMNKTLYKHIHSMHHRLYVPYAFGTLYNHPLEGFFIDTMGALVAQTLSCMSVRQATFLFTITTLKAVDVHCGYTLPWDPFPAFFGNGADYHDIHHQRIGIKHNFSQPYFIHWDVLLGTHMSREDIIAIRSKNESKATKTQ